MVAVAATTFVRNFGRYKTEAQHEPVAVTSHGRTEGYFISAAAFEQFQTVMREARKAYHPNELPPHLTSAVRKASMDSRHADLDSLLDE